ncbi:MAG: hypothetical protein ACREFX_01855 [Opitutaceae bacterium]
MMIPDVPRFRRFLRLAAGVGAAAAVLSGVLAWLSPATAVEAYRFAAFACFQAAAGSLIFLLIYRNTGGQWGDFLGPFLRAGARLVPWIWPLIAWMAAVPAAHPSWTSPRGRPMPSPGMLLGRAAIYEVIYIAIVWVALSPRTRKLAGLALVIYVVTTHFLTADWFFTLEPGWYSTIFPLFWMAIQACAGLALAVVAAWMSGRDPSVPGPAGRPLGKDWGDLLLTTVLFSCYTLFMEIVIYWSGDLPREISWYARRSAGGWKWVCVALALLHCALPLWLLLSRRRKRSRHGVPRVALILTAAEMLWVAWFVLPAFPQGGAWLWGMSAVLLVGAGGLFLNRYGAVALVSEGGHP